MAFGMTFFNIFDIPVFWPILLVYFIVLMVGLGLCSALPCSALLGSVRFGSVRFGSVRFGLVWFGLVWFGLVWFSSVRCGPVRSGPVRSGPVRCGCVRLFCVETACSARAPLCACFESAFVLLAERTLDRTWGCQGAGLAGDNSPHQWRGAHARRSLRSENSLPLHSFSGNVKLCTWRCFPLVKNRLSRVVNAYSRAPSCTSLPLRRIDCTVSFCV